MNSGEENAALAVPAQGETTEFQPCVVVNEEAGITEAVFEDTAYVAVPVFDGVHHYMDKHLAVDDHRLVGFAVWSVRPTEQPALAVPAQGEITVPARDGIEAQRGLNDVFPGDPYPVTDQLKRGLDKLRAEASRGSVSSREIFNLTDPLMDILTRTGNRT